MKEMVSIETIKVGERARTDLGDLTDLIKSIEDVGLIQPIVITSGGRLIAGGRRLEACRRLGMLRVPVVVAEHINDAVGLLKAEQDENTCRKDMTVSELLAIAARIEEMKRPEAQERIRATQAKPGQQAARHSESLGSSTAGGAQNEAQRRARKYETAALAADAIGMSRSTYYLVKAVKKHADDPEQPTAVREAAGEALAEMDATGKFSPAYDRFVTKATELKRRPIHSHAETPPKAPPLTDGQGRRYPQRSQRKALSEGLAALSGLCAGLASVTDLDDSVNAEEAARWTRDLNQALRVLRSLNNKLKEHVNGIR